MEQKVVRDKVLPIIAERIKKLIEITEGEMSTSRHSFTHELIVETLKFNTQIFYSILKLHGHWLDRARSNNVLIEQIDSFFYKSE